MIPEGYESSGGIVPDNGGKLTHNLPQRGLASIDERPQQKHQIGLGIIVARGARRTSIKAGPPNDSETLIRLESPMGCL